MGSTAAHGPAVGGVGGLCTPAESVAVVTVKCAGAGRHPPRRGTQTATDEGACVSGESTTARHRSRVPPLERRLDATRQTVNARRLPPVPGLFPHRPVAGVHHTRPHGAAAST